MYWVTGAVLAEVLGVPMGAAVVLGGGAGVPGTTVMEVRVEGVAAG